MKKRKPIILSGPKASGKTHTAMGIKAFYPKEQTAHLFSKITDLKYFKKELEKHEVSMKLIIVDNCINLQDIINVDVFLTEKILPNHPEVNFIYCTQSIINLDKRFHIIYFKENSLTSIFWVDEFSNNIDPEKIDGLKKKYDASGTKKD